MSIYNSRNYSILLNYRVDGVARVSTTVEIILYYLTYNSSSNDINIYNSRNYSILLNVDQLGASMGSTTVEIILYYLTFNE